MTKAKKDADRAFDAARLILDGRDIATNCDKAKAAAMLNEGLLQGVEARLAGYNI